jgi:23S rRNA pseudouridine2605 synthase
MGERLQKFLARAGVASRRRSEQLIAEGRVSVNDRQVAQMGAQIEPGRDRVTVDGRAVQPPRVSGYFLLYKPAGVVTTLADPEGRATVADSVRKMSRRLFPVGRLDYDAEGALILTDDGSLAHRLSHPTFGVRRTYLAKVKGAPDAAALERLRRGVRLEDGPAQPISVDLFRRAERNTWLAIVVAEGRPHLIKRLCAAVGHPVLRLFRPSYAGVAVASMKPGELRPLRSSEVEALRAAAAGRQIGDIEELFLPPRRHRAAGEGPLARRDQASRRQTNASRPGRRQGSSSKRRVR